MWPFKKKEVVEAKVPRKFYVKDPARVRLLAEILDDGKTYHTDYKHFTSKEHFTFWTLVLEEVPAVSSGRWWYRTDYLPLSIEIIEVLPND